MDHEDRKGMSMCLSQVLEDIGVNRRTIAKRRSTWLELETMRTVITGISLYHFGSQSEGTTTAGMMSDIDTLFCLNDMPVILDWSEWKEGKPHLLVIKTEESPPQHCWLQEFRRDLPLPELQADSPSKLKDRAGRVLITNTQVERHHFLRKSTVSGQVFQHGPSMSWDEATDVVAAYHCVSLPEECNFVFQRPRPGHWPIPDTLAKAKKTGVFLVPQGYSESPSKRTICRSTALHVTPYDPDYPISKREWRFSTSMMERLLVFDWNTIQIKVYVIVKIIRIAFFKPIFGDRLSTFHIKTAMLFTTEAYPPEIWREDNIAQCVIYCLVTLRRWLNIKFCPHYTIAGVNLFTGKLFSHEITIIAETITSMIGSNLQCIYLIEMDLLGARMSTLSSGVRMSESRSWRRSNQINILYVSVGQYSIMLQSLITSLVVIQNNLKAVSLSQIIDRLVHISEQGTALQQEAASVLIPSLRCTLSSVLASRCINQGQPITPDILHLYQLSFDSDLLSSRLKFASMLYCCGQYEAAANCLTYCEGLLGPGVWQFCSCTNTYPEKPNKKYLENALKKSNTTILRKYTYFCINFTRHEMCCIPQFLVFERFRTISEEDRQHPLHYEWMDLVAVDCEPFLHYLQFLTYRHLNQHDQTRKQMLKLDSFIENNFGRGHFDTTLNMLGHCFELLDMRDKAWMYYGKSLQLYPQNNAANWHVARLVHRRFTKENKLALGGNPHGSTS